MVVVLQDARLVVLAVLITSGVNGINDIVVCGLLGEDRQCVQEVGRVTADRFDIRTSH